MTEYFPDYMNPTTLRIPEIKDYLHDGIKGRLTEAGFKFRKSDFFFIRKHGKDRETFIFLFYNYHPIQYKVHFLLDIWNDQVETIKKQLPIKQDIESFDFRSIMIPMGKFMDKRDIAAAFYKDPIVMARFEERNIARNDIEHNLSLAQINGFSYRLVHADDLFDTIEKMNTLMINKVLPIATQLSSIEGIEQFFTARPGWSVNSLSLNTILTELIAAKLVGARDFHEVFNNLMSEMDKKAAEEDHWRKIKDVVANVYKCIK